MQLVSLKQQVSVLASGLSGFKQPFIFVSLHIKRFLYRTTFFPYFMLIGSSSSSLACFKGISVPLIQLYSLNRNQIFHLQLYQQPGGKDEIFKIFPCCVIPHSHPWSTLPFTGRSIILLPAFRHLEKKFKILKFFKHVVSFRFLLMN